LKKYHAESEEVWLEFTILVKQTSKQTRIIAMSQ